MKLKDLFPELEGYLWGNSCVDLGDVEIGYIDGDLVISGAQNNNNSLSLAVSKREFALLIVVNDNSRHEDDPRCETGVAEVTRHIEFE